MPNYFTTEELRCKCGCQQNKIDQAFLEKLNEFREKWGSPLIVTSGYRCPSHNKRVSFTGETGPHTTGKAVDITCLGGTNRFKFVKMAMESGFTRIGIADSFIHLDTLTTQDKVASPAIWIY